MFSQLYAPCSEMLSSFRDPCLIPASAQSPISKRQPRFNVAPTSKLADVLRKFVAVQTHRLWVTDNREHPVGVVSLTDVLGFIRSMLPNEAQ
jgi:CBS domain containing-hemolysin-like protein